MPLITRSLCCKNLKVSGTGPALHHDRNILVGDTESGKSTILLALTFVLSDSRHRSRHCVESLLSQSAVRQFQGR